MWGSWFGGQSAQKRKDAPKKAILDLRQQLDMLQKREKHLENQMAQQDKIARDNVSTNKTGGLPLQALTLSDHLSRVGENRVAAHGISERDGGFWNATEEFWYL